MSSKKKSPEALLKRAEHQFTIGNYIVAKKEFEKANKNFNSEDIAAKIIHCEQELAKEKAQELIKKGKKSIGKKAFKEALRCYEEAYETLRESWLLEKIEELRANVTELDVLAEAGRLAQEGAYDKAAELYGKAVETSHAPPLLLKQAACYVMAGQYAEAAAIYNKIELNTDRDLYYKGTALIGLERYYDGLRMWDAISKTNADLENQKNIVRLRLVKQLHRLASRNLTEFPEMIYQQALYVSDDSQCQALICNILKAARIALIKQLWQEEKYLEIHELVQPWHDADDPMMLGLYTRLYFRLAYMSPDFISQFLIFWVTGVYHPALYANLATNGIEPETLREQFVQAGEDLIRQYINTGEQEAEKFLTIIQKQKTLIQRCYGLYPKKRRTFPVCTPQFAFRFGFSDQISQLIEKKKKAFKNHAEYLETGAYYCQLGTGLIYLDQGDYQQAYDSVKPYMGKQLNEFEAYCLERVSFEYGLYCIEHELEPPARIFENAAVLLQKSPDLEAAYVEKTKADFPDTILKGHERALKEIMQHHASPGTKQALSYVTTRLCIMRLNQRQINVKTAESLLEKALKLDPDNELAKSSAHQLRKELELEELHKSMNRLKMNKAVKIANESEHPEVRTAFFDYIEYQLDHMRDTWNKESKQYYSLLIDMGKWCARVDEEHPILYSINDMITSIEKD